MSDILLDVQHLTHCFPLPGRQTLRAVNDVSFQLKQGEILGLVGESGCGKSTVARCIMNVYRPTAGHIYYDGIDTCDAAQYRANRRRLEAERQLIFQDSTSSLNPRMTAAEIIAEPMAIHHMKPPRGSLRAEAAFQLYYVGMEESYLDKYPPELSGGQRQRVGIAQALLGNPPFLIFDEPTVGLDPEERIHFRNLFSRTAEEHLVLLSTHIIEDVQSVCDQIVVIHHGTILFTGTPEQLIQSAAGHVGVFWEKDERQEQGLHITARVNTSQGVRCRAVADKLPPYAQAEEPTLEDAYLYLLSREAVQ